MADITSDMAEADRIEHEYVVSTCLNIWSAKC